MPIGTRTYLGNNSSVSGNNFLTLTTTASVPAGDSIIVSFEVDSNSRLLSSITDSAGNTYNIDVDRNHASGSRHLYIASCHNAAALASGGTITATLSTSAGSRRAMEAFTIPGLAASSTLDKTSTNEGNGTALTTGSSGTLTQADELVVGTFVTASTSAFTMGSGWSGQGAFLTGGGRLATEIKVVSATTAQNADATCGSAVWVGCLASYKAASSGTSDPATPGVATASGVTPHAKTSASPGAATTTGTSPSASASAPAGQAAAAGIAPTASATAPVGTAATAGISPAASTSVDPGTAGAAGIAPSASAGESAAPGTATGVGIAPTSTASDTPTQGIATVQGISPTDSALDTTPTPGVVSARGVSPTARVTAVAGAATAAGVEPAAVAGPAGIGAAAASGIDPTASTSSTPAPAIATAAGIEPGAVALAGVGVATTTGVTPGELFIRPTPGRIALTDEPRDRVTTTTQETAAGIHLSDALRDRISLS